MEIFQRLDQLAIDPERPLIVCDADEVLFLFLQGFEAYLETQGHFMELTSFALTGNVKARSSGLAVDAETVKTLLDGFFETETARLAPVPGAASALAEAARFAQIVILSNLPLHAQEMRAASLKRHAMDYPLIAWTGGKGAPVARLSARTRRSSLFIDDLPPHHTSVAKAAPEVVRLHMIADPRLRPLIGPAPDAHARHDDWPDALAFIRQRLAP